MAWSSLFLGVCWAECPGNTILSTVHVKNVGSAPLDTSHHLTDGKASLTLMETPEGSWRRDPNHYATEAWPDCSVNIVLLYIGPACKPIPDSGEHLYVGCHLSTHSVWSTCLVPVRGRCDDRGGTQSLQLETPICRKYESWWWAMFWIMTGISVSHLKCCGNQKLEFSVAQEHFWVYFKCC